MYVKNHHFTKSFIKLGTVCACVCVLGEERSIGIILVFPYELLQSKGKGKMEGVQVHVIQLIQR